MSFTLTSDNKCCRCCLTKENLKSLEEPQFYNGKMENYRKMLTKCFAIEILLEENWICTSCINRLRACYSFRRCIVSAKKYLEKHLSSAQGSDLSSGVDNLDPNVYGPLILNNDVRGTKRKTKHNDLKTYDIEQQHYDFDVNGIVLEPESSQNPNKSNKYISKNNDLEDDCDDVINLSDGSKNNSDNDDDDNFFSSVDNPKSVKSKTETDAKDSKFVPYVVNSTDRVCDICHEEFSFYKDLLQHMHRHYPNHICDVCGKVCSTQRSLLSHSLVHNDVRYNCNECDKSFKSKATLKKHIMVKHRGEKIFFKCNVCKEKLPTYNEKLKHLAEKHGRTDKMYKCLQCSVKYRLGGQLRAHMRKVHLQEKNHTCMECGAAFFRRTCLTKHMMKHSGQSSYTCNICNKYYTRKDSLRQHIKSHCMDKKNYLVGPPMQQMPKPCDIMDNRY